jgi:hypothetical protein
MTVIVLIDMVILSLKCAAKLAHRLHYVRKWINKHCRRNRPVSEVLVEREKTKRTLIVAASTTLISIIAMVMFFRNIDDRGGSLKVSDKGLEVTLEEPIPQQLGAESQTARPFGDSVALTTGTIADTTLKRVRSLPLVRGFSGSNFIDTTAGYILPSDQPQSWTVKDSSNVRVFAGTDGSTISIVKDERPDRKDAVSATQVLIDSLRRIGVRATSQTDTAHATSLVWYQEHQSRRVISVKFMQTADRLYTVKAEAPNETAMKSVVRSVSGFTPIEQKSAAKTPETRRLQR